MKSPEIEAGGTAGRLGRLGSAALALALLTPAFAAEPKFEVSVGVGETYTDNVGYVADAEESDAVTKIQAEFPFVHEGPTRSWALSYRPSYYKYDEFDDLDHVEHLARLGLTLTPRASTTHFFDLSYSSTQSQTAPLESESSPEFTTSRTDRQTLTGTYRTDHRVRPRWTLNSSLGGRTLAIDDISGFDSGVTDEQLGDQIRYDGSLGATRELSRRSSVAFGYRYSFYDLDLSPDETVHSVFTEFARTVGPGVELTYGGGVASRSGGEDDTVDVTADVGLVRSFQLGALSLGASRSVRNGDAIAGGSTVNTASIRYTSTDSPRWRWSALTRYSLREPLDSTESDLNYFRGEVNLTYRGRRFKTGRLQESIGFRIRGAIIDQSGDDDELLDSSYYVVNASILAFFGV